MQQSQQQAKILPFPTASPVYLAGQAIHNLVSALPPSTGYFLGVVLVVLLTGHLAQCKGSLARAVYPFVAHLTWGWHRCERVLARGQFCLDTLFEQAYAWCLTELAAEPVRLGPQQREVQALDSSTIARWRAVKRLGAAGKGYWGRAGKAVRANLVAAINSVVLIGGLRCGLVRRTRFGATCEAAVAALWQELPPCAGLRLVVVEAGIATQEQFTLATRETALLGRLRKNAKRRCAPPPPTGQRGRRRKHGAVLHPGAAQPEVEPTETGACWRTDERGVRRRVQLRRWAELHFEEAATTVLDVVRVDDPKYDKPLLVGSAARELRLEEFLVGYECRPTIETNFYVGQDSCAMEMPRAFTQQAVTRRLSLALLAGSLLKALAARCPALALGPWDRQPQRSGGRLAHYLSQHAAYFAEVALAGLPVRNDRKKVSGLITNVLRLQRAA